MQNDLAALKDKLTSVKDLLIVIATSPALDTVAAALSLYLSLLDSGKSVSLVCGSELTVRDSHLVGVDKIKHDLGGQNLVITINREGDVVDKVTSATDNGKLSLTIIPKIGQPALTESDIAFSSSGASSELILAVGGSSLSDFPELSAPTIVNISNHASSFGVINLVDPNSSLSELVTALVQELALPMSQDIAGNLMQGIESATNDFQASTMTADTFEALAILYRAGARHQVRVNKQTATIIDNMPVIEEKQQEDQKDIAALETKLHEMTNPDPNWLKPKIFTSSSDK